MKARKVAARRPWWAWLVERDACWQAMAYARGKASLNEALRDLERELPEARASWLLWLLMRLLELDVDGPGPREFCDLGGRIDPDRRAWHVLDCRISGYADCDFGRSEGKRMRLERDYARLSARAVRLIRSRWRRYVGDPNSPWCRR